MRSSRSSANSRYPFEREEWVEAGVFADQGCPRFIDESCPGEGQHTRPLLQVSDALGAQ